MIPYYLEDEIEEVSEGANNMCSGAMILSSRKYQGKGARIKGLN